MRRFAALSGLIVVSLAATVSCGFSSTSAQSSSTPTTPIVQESTALGDQPKSSAMAEAMGEFVSGEHPTTGTATIVTEGEMRYVEFSDQFATDAGPDLFVILHKSPNVIETTAPPAHSIREEDYVLLAPLQSINGSQRYAIPTDLDLSQYASVVIWCRQFNATFGAASLQ